MRRIEPLGEGSRIHVPDSWLERLSLEGLFGSPAPVEVEIGSGSGAFLAQWAGRHPGRNFLGVERMLGRIRKMDRKFFRLGLDNLRLIRVEASYLVERLLPLRSVQAFHIYFPDPWPKRRHSRRRLVQPRFVASLGRALAPDGRVFLRTDDAPYFKEMQSAFEADGGFEAGEGLPGLDECRTEFEARFRDQGIPVLRAGYRRRR